MRSLFQSESFRETKLLHTILSPQLWLQVEKNKASKLSSFSPASIEPLIKVSEPQILPVFKPIDYVEELARAHEGLECCAPQDRSKLYLFQCQVFKGLGESKLLQRSIRSAWETATTAHDKLIFGAWLRYLRRGEAPIIDLLASCAKCCKETEQLDVASWFPSDDVDAFDGCNPYPSSVCDTVYFVINEERIACDRQRIAALSTPLYQMLNGSFLESQLECIDMSENGISLIAMKSINDFSTFGRLRDRLPRDVLLEILTFASKFCCDKLKDECDRRLASLVNSRQDAIDFIYWALEECTPVLAASCLQCFLKELPDCLNDQQVVEIFAGADKCQMLTLAGGSSFSLYCFLSEVAMDVNPMSETSVAFSERMLDTAIDYWQKQLAYHQLACVRLLRKEYSKAESMFNAAFNAGHVYSIVGLARLASIMENKLLSYKKLSSVISSYAPQGWMFQERSLYSGGNAKWHDLDKATELDPTLLYPYIFRSKYLMKKQSAKAALQEINHILGFKLTLDCLEVRFCCYLALEDYRAALLDLQVILSLEPDYKMFEGRVAASQLHMLVREHVEPCTNADCWLQLYDRWSSVDDIGSLSIIYQMLDTEDAKGIVYFRQYLLLLRVNCPEAAMHSLQLACKHAKADYERLVYEGWILYDTGHCDEALSKAEESISIQRSFEAFFLKAYALGDTRNDPKSYKVVISLLEEALKCPSDRLRKGQALNNLGSVYVDCGELDKAAECYMNAVKIQHTRAHQGLARVHFLKNDRAAAYDEMTKLIERAGNNASAYEKRSEYCEHQLTLSDLQMATKLDPLRVYPYRYRAAVLMDNHNEKEAIAELTKAIAFKPDIHILHLRAAFHEHVGDIPSALRDCRAALSLDPNHQEMLELRNRVNNQEP